jgi:plastocyanin
MRKLLVLIGASLALAGCGGGGGGSSESATTTETTSGGSAAQTVTVSEAEYSLTPNKIQISEPGSVAIKVRNIGHVAHALEIEGNGVKEEIDALQPGASATLTVKLTKTGSYELYCPIDGHRAKGMAGTLQVGGSPSTGGMTTTEGTTTDDKGGSGY